MDFLEQSKRQWEKLNADDAAAKAAKTLVGRYIQHPYADGNAIYKIASVSATKATVEVVDIDDGWVLPAWGRKAAIPLSKAREMVGQRDALDRLFAVGDQWWEKQRVGATVHYHNGFDQFVRCVVVVVDGEKQIRPTALVGSGWRAHDLPARNTDGTVRYPHHVAQIKNGEVFRPHQLNIFEHPDFVLRGGAANPTTLAPLALEPPTMTPEAEALAVLARLHAKVISALDVSHLRSSDPVAYAEAFRLALAKAKDLLQ